MRHPSDALCALSAGLWHVSIFIKKSSYVYFFGATAPHTKWKIKNLQAFKKFKITYVSPYLKCASVRERYNHCVLERASWTKRGMSFQWILNECNAHMRLIPPFCPLSLSGFQLMLWLSVAILALHTSNSLKLDQFWIELFCRTWPIQQNRSCTKFILTEKWRIYKALKFSNI